jgi:hypothetical protein
MPVLRSFFTCTKHKQTFLRWKVSAKELSKPNYIFGTYLFLSSAFVDTLSAVKSLLVVGHCAE